MKSVYEEERITIQYEIKRFKNIIKIAEEQKIHYTKLLKIFERLLKDHDEKHSPEKDALFTNITNPSEPTADKGEVVGEGGKIKKS